MNAEAGRCVGAACIVAHIEHDVLARRVAAVQTRDRRRQCAQCVATTDLVEHRHADRLHNNAGAERPRSFELIEDDDACALRTQQGRCAEAGDAATGNGDIERPNHA